MTAVVSAGVIGAVNCKSGRTPGTRAEAGAGHGPLRREHDAINCNTGHAPVSTAVRWSGRRVQLIATLPAFSSGVGPTILASDNLSLSDPSLGKPSAPTLGMSAYEAKRSSKARF
jgi:hypothetical protein